ncbi:transcriptional repressor general negative regulator of transcription subunit 4, variant 2 [Mucor circinelloides]
MESANRRHLSSMRVVQKNLVYIIGLHPRLASEEIVRSNDYFGQFGKISKIVINKRPALPASQMTSQPSAAVYVTYYRKEDAAKAIAAVDGSVIADRVVRASYGTTKYCTYYLRNMTCPNPNCLYLHEQGEDMDTISKEELATGKHHMRDMLTEDDDDEHRYEASSSHQNHHHQQHSTPQQQRPQLSSDDFPAVSSSSKTSKATDDSALPASASWAKIGVSSTPSTPVLGVSDAFGPTLSAAVAASQQKTQFPPMPKRKSEKKKRKEQLQQQKTTTESSTSQPATPKSVAATIASPSMSSSVNGKSVTEESQLEEPAALSSPSSSNGAPQSQQSAEQEGAAVPATQHSVFDQGLTGFVLGQAYRDLCPLPTEAEFESKQRQDDKAAEELTLGVSALLLGDDAKAEPSPAQRNLEAIQSASTSKLIPSTIPSVLDFLTYSTPTPKYTSMFNPFAHMNMLGGQQQQQQHPNNAGNGAAAAAAAVLNNNLDSSIRRHSRFGFAQA